MVKHFLVLVHQGDRKGRWEDGQVQRFCLERLVHALKEKQEVCAVSSLDEHTAQRHVQFRVVFNLLHAGARYLPVHQQGFGAVGVSKYG